MAFEGWLDALQPIIGRQHARHIEIGSHQGDSAIWMLEHVLTADSARITCVDCWDDSVNDGRTDAAAAERAFDQRVLEGGYGPKLTKLRGFSGNVLRYLMQAPTFDSAYIDASHDARSTLVDSVLVWPLVRPGGVVIWDDYAWQVVPGETERPKLAIDSFLAVYAGHYDVLGVGWQMLVRKR